MGKTAVASPSRSASTLTSPRRGICSARVVRSGLYNPWTSADHLNQTRPCAPTLSDGPVTVSRPSPGFFGLCYQQSQLPP